MPEATFTRPDLTSFTGLDGLGLEVTGQFLEPGRAVLACRLVEPVDWCRRCRRQGLRRGTVTRELAHDPFGSRRRTLLVTLRRYRCAACAHVWRQETSAAAGPGPKSPGPGSVRVWPGSWSATCGWPAPPRGWACHGTRPTTRS